jgi:hypothetical protein
MIIQGRYVWTVVEINIPVRITTIFKEGTNLGVVMLYSPVEAH